MKKLISFSLAGQLSILLFGLFVLFHLSIIIGIVLFDYAPIDYLWGGRMQSKDELLNFEFLSLGVISLCLIVVLIRVKKTGLPILLSLTRFILWVLFVLFTLNTIGNLLAQSVFEKFFAIATLVLALSCLRLAIEPINSSE